MQTISRALVGALAAAAILAGVSGAAAAQPAPFWIQASGPAVAEFRHGGLHLPVPGHLIGPITDHPAAGISFSAIGGVQVVVVATGPAAACRIMVGGAVVAQDSGTRAVCTWTN
jgi:hypothetical protein